MGTSIFTFIDYAKENKKYPQSLPSNSKSFCVKLAPTGILDKNLQNSKYFKVIISIVPIERTRENLFAASQNLWND